MKWLVALVIVLAGCASQPSEPADVSAFQIDADPYLGTPGAPVAVIAFEAPACINCANFHNNKLPTLIEQYFDTNQAVLYMKQWTVGYPYDEAAGIALECTVAMGGNAPYFALQHEIYTGAQDSGALQAALFRVAKEYDLDENELFACHDNPELESYQAAQQRMEQDIALGITNGGAGSSPSFFIISSKGTEYLGGNGEKLHERLEALT